MWLSLLRITSLSLRHLVVDPLRLILSITYSIIYHNRSCLRTLVCWRAENGLMISTILYLNPCGFRFIERKPYWLFDLVSPYHHKHCGSIRRLVNKSLWCRNFSYCYTLCRLGIGVKDPLTAIKLVINQPSSLGLDLAWATKVVLISVVIYIRQCVGLVMILQSSASFLCNTNHDL